MMISIIIPSYNQQEYLPKAIESALAQTMPCEVIVVDDGSTDNSLEIARRYPVKIISQVNKGLASARNTGIMQVSNHNPFVYLLFLDADDILMDNCAEKIQNKINETQADIIAPSFRTFGTSNQKIILMPNPKLEDFRTGNRIGYCSAIRRSKLLEVGGYSPRMVEGYEDMHLWINLLTRGAKITTIPEVLWLYRTKPESMFRDALQHHQKLLAQINKDFPEANINY